MFRWHTKDLPFSYHESRKRFLLAGTSLKLDPLGSRPTFDDLSSSLNLFHHRRPTVPSTIPSQDVPTILSRRARGLINGRLRGDRVEISKLELSRHFVFHPARVSRSFSFLFSRESTFKLHHAAVALILSYVVPRR